jgi:NADH dehydrogenase
VGGGPTGVELAGSFAELKKYILPREYPELNASEMDIYLVQGDTKVLSTFSEKASIKARNYLEELGVNVLTGVRVTQYDGNEVTLSDGRKLHTRKVIWTAGITGKRFEGIPEACYTRDNRLKVNQFNQVEGTNNVYAIGDAAYMEEAEYKGHPQVAQPALQQGARLAKNLNGAVKGKAMIPFHYRDLGSMATIGRHKAVAEFPFWKTQGYFAWILWLGVHLIQILGVKNKFFIFINWVWSYFTMDQSLRIMVRHRTK